MNRRIQLWLGVSALALLGVVTLPVPVLAGAGQGNSQDLDPDGGMRNECGEASGCAEAGESFESTTLDELGEDEDSQFAPRARPRHSGSLSDGDSVSGRLRGGGGLGGSSGGLGD